MLAHRSAMSIPGMPAATVVMVAAAVAMVMVMAAAAAAAAAGAGAVVLMPVMAMPVVVLRAEMMNATTKQSFNETVEWTNLILRYPPSCTAGPLNQKKAPAPAPAPASPPPAPAPAPAPALALALARVAQPLPCDRQLAGK